MNKIKKENTKKVYYVLRLLILICMIIQGLRMRYENALLCLLALLLLMLPPLAQKKFKILLPEVLEIIILFLIFGSTILGEIQNFYSVIPIWDSLLHIVNGFLSAAIGFSLIELLNKNSEKFSLSPLYIFIVAFSFSMTIGVIWEFFEYTMDNVVKTDMQKDKIVNKISSVSLDKENKNKAIDINNISYTILYDKDNKEIIKIENGYLDIGLNDTIKDLMVNAAGAIIFLSIGIVLINKNNMEYFKNKLVPRKNKVNA